MDIGVGWSSRDAAVVYGSVRGRSAVGCSMRDAFLPLLRTTWAKALAQLQQGVANGIACRAVAFLRCMFSMLPPPLSTLPPPALAEALQPSPEAPRHPPAPTRTKRIPFSIANPGPGHDSLEPTISLRLTRQTTTTIHHHQAIRSPHRTAIPPAPPSAL